MRKIIQPCGFHCIKINNLGVSFGEQTVLEDVNMHIHCGSFNVIIGQNGAGKSTLIKAILGEIPHTGTIEFKDTKDGHMAKLKIGYVPQSVNIEKNTPVSVYDLIASYQYNYPVFLPKSKKIEAKIRETLEVFEAEELIDKQVCNLSGGQLQRVLLSMAIMDEPNLLLLDEPLGALDLKLRREMQLELKRIQRESGITFIFVTHDQEEALTMSDRVAVMSAGHILQLGTPEDIYNEPQSAFVADFIGDSDIMAGTMVRDRLVRFLGCDFACVDTGFGENAEVDVVLRPEDVKLKPIDDPAQNVPQGVVESLLFKGVHYEMKVRVGDNVLLVHSTHARPVGTQVKLTVAPEDIQVMRKSDYSPDILKRHAARA